ncbi:heavy-metal-associated domain-containing protein [Ferruginibacter sp.]
MRCGGCESQVKKALLQIPGVTEAEVQLQPQRAIVTMSKNIDVAELQTQLSNAGNYTIKEIIAAN